MSPASADTRGSGTRRAVLVTGASGFIGQAALRALAHTDYEIHAISRNGTSALPRNAVSHQCDLLESGNVEKLIMEIRPTHLLHLAWSVAPGDVYETSENLRWLESSLRTVRLFYEQGGARAVVSGSCAEYDWSRGLCSEHDTSVAPSSLYGTTKDALRRVLQAYCDKRTVGWAWARIFFAYGPGEHPSRLVPSVCRALLENRAPQCSHGLQQRDFVYVDDVARVLVELLGGSYRGAVNVGSGQSYSVRQVATELHRLIPDAPAPVFAPPTTPTPDVVVADTSLQRQVSSGQLTPLGEGLRRCLEWWRDSLSGQHAK